MADSPGLGHAVSDVPLESVRCSADLKQKLREYTAEMSGAIGSQLVRIYLYGSLARGCSNEVTSDVDVIVVTASQCQDEIAARALEAHENSAIPIDATFVTRLQLQSSETPTEVDFVLKPMSKDRLMRLPEGHKDFLLQRQDSYDCNANLAGPPAREVLRPVPWEKLACCLDYLFPHVLQRFKNPELMMCRIAYAFAHHRLCSKRDAGEWALQAFDTGWRPTIDRALGAYAEGLPHLRSQLAELQAFEKYCAGYIAGVRREEPVKPSSRKG